MLTDTEIETAIAITETELPHYHMHLDCVRIAYQWLDAQDKTDRPLRKTFPIKHMIENWAGHYVSQSDVEVAAKMHPEIRGKYPWFNISANICYPHMRRLAGIGEALAYQDYLEHGPDKDIHRVYVTREP